MVETRVSIEEIKGKNDPTKNNVTLLVNAWQIKNGEPVNGDTFNYSVDKESDRLDKDNDGKPKVVEDIKKRYKERISDLNSKADNLDEGVTY